MSRKISVVVPTYRRPALLRKCLEALSLQQFDHSDYEIVVVSDGPDHATHDMLNNLQGMPHPFIQYLSLARNSGPAAARNAGWRAATGRLIAFTDDDTQPAADWLSSLWNAFGFFGEPAYIAFSGQVTVPLPDEPTDFELNTSHLETADFVTANCACTPAALNLVNGFDERFTTAWREDSDLEFRFMENNIPIRKIGEAVVVHPVRAARWGVSIRDQKKTMFNALLYKKFPALFRTKIQQAPAWNYYLIIAGFLMCITGIMIRSGLIVTLGAALYLSLTISFIARRLAATSRSTKHIAEMVVTSLVIPFASIYWTIYGAVKYRVLFY